jgi:hypothetical protein
MMNVPLHFGRLITYWSMAMAHRWPWCMVHTPILVLEFDGRLIKEDGGVRVVIDGELVVISGDAGSFLVIPSSSTYLEICIFS